MGDCEVLGLGEGPVGVGSDEVDPAHEGLLLVVDRDHLPEFGVIELVGELLYSAVLDEPDLAVRGVAGVEQVLGGEDGAFEGLGDAVDGLAPELLELAAPFDDLDVDLLKQGSFEVGGDGLEHLLLLFGVVHGLDLVFVEVVGAYLVLEVV